MFGLSTSKLRTIGFLCGSEFSTKAEQSYREKIVQRSWRFIRVSPSNLDRLQCSAAITFLLGFFGVRDTNRAFSWLESFLIFINHFFFPFYTRYIKFSNTSVQNLIQNMQVNNVNNLWWACVSANTALRAGLGIFIYFHFQFWNFKSLTS